MSKLYVGNLSYSTTEEDVQDLFATEGSVVSVRLITDRDSGRPKGFGFVEMEDRGAMESCISKYDGFEFQGRPLRVNEAQDKPRTGGGGGGY